MPALATFPAFPVNAGSSATVKARVLEKEFGDGYAQRAADGLNTVTLTYRAEFAYRAQADVDAMDAFLTARAGHTSFLFTIPGEARARRWVCAEWRKTRQTPALWSLTATFVEDFGL